MFRWVIPFLFAGDSQKSAYFCKGDALEDLCPDELSEEACKVILHMEDDCLNTRWEGSRGRKGGIGIGTSTRGVLKRVLKWSYRTR